MEVGRNWTYLDTSVIFMNTNRDAMLNEAKFKSERYAHQLVRSAFPIEVNVEEDQYAKYIYGQLKSDLERFFNLHVPPATDMVQGEVLLQALSIFGGVHEKGGRA
jgi:hypothetical protein